MGLFFWQVPTAEEIAEVEENRKRLMQALDEREVFVRSHCINEWTDEQMRVMKVGCCGFDPSETAAVLGLTEEAVLNIQRSIIETIFEPWPREEEVAEAFIGHWFSSHKDCCASREHKELFTDHYPLAELRGIQQPKDRLTAIANLHIDFSQWDDSWFDKPYCDPPSTRTRKRHRRNPSGPATA